MINEKLVLLILMQDNLQMIIVAEQQVYGG